MKKGHGTSSPECEGTRLLSGPPSTDFTTNKPKKRSFRESPPASS